ncbi:MAG: hypothetical protein A2309_14645 [Bacteroidetes bacterium RIFOXYB2_FULL_35_7]|nr:MAG: hypothetical protein A2309_14645 [Bacteroidetes bacterium RIFOXYB2_FULL_35_7]
MKKFLLLSIAALFLFSANKTSAQIFTTNWDEQNGIPYHQSFDMNTGFHSFTTDEEGRSAFLLKQDNLIRVFQNGNKIKDIEIVSGAKDFCFYQDNFFILYQNFIAQISMYNNTVEYYKISGKDFEKISVSENLMYLYSSSQKTSVYNAKNKSEFLFIKEKILFSNHTEIFSEKISNHNFTLQFNKIKKNFHTVKKLASAVVAGYSNNKIYLDVQYIVHEIPLKAEREIWIIPTSINGFSENISIVKIPDCYYIYVKNDILVNENGCFYSLTTPFGIEIHEINETTNILLPAQYEGVHFNNLLLESKEGDVSGSNSNKAPITRAEIIAYAEPYETHVWTCSASNIKDYLCNGKQVLTPSWVTVGTHHALPYMWGGWSNLTQFNQGLLNNVSAGDCNTTGGGAGASCAVGVDCSGFVSRAWNLSSKYGTSTLPNISTAYASFTQLLPGDIVNYAGHHVRLIHTLNANGSFYIIESSASATDWRVGYCTYTVANLQSSYIPRYYNDVINTIPDTVPPVTTMVTSNWHTEDFDVNFTDTDSSGIQSLYWLPTGLSESTWTTNQQLGFMYNNFNDTINPDWTLVEPSWSFINGAINQSNESLTQNNAYTQLEQDSTSSYLFNWKMKLSGSETDRRAGIYIFADSATALQRNNSYMIYYRADLDLCQIYKSTNNTITLMEEDPCVIDENNWFDCKVTYNPVNGIITAYLNNEPISSWTDPEPLKSGKYLSLRTGSCNALFDEFRVYRSRQNLMTVTTGINGMIQSENPDPATPACNIHSIAIDLADNFRITNFLTNIDLTAPNEVNEISDLNISDVDTIVVAVEPSCYWSPSSDINSGIIGYRFALGTAPGFSNIYNWSFTADTQATCSSVNLLENQVYYFSVKAVNNAGLESQASSSDGFVFVTNTSEKRNNNITDIVIYPNPASYKIYFITSDKTVKSFSLSDIRGKILKQSELNDSKFSIAVHDISDGIYFLNFFDENKQVVKTEKVIIKANYE